MMKKTVLALVCLCGIISSLFAQRLPAGWWRASLLRADSSTIDFNVEIKYNSGKPTWFIRNASERIAVPDIQQKGDSIFVQMPLFESAFQLHVEKDGSIRGMWTKVTSRLVQVMPVVMVYNKPLRFPVSKKPIFNVSGRWAVTFVDNNIPEPAVAEFNQTGHQLTGTFITPTGDYRYLEGVVDGNTIHLSTFDGSHAYYFNGQINSNTSISNGLYYSGSTFKESWTAIKNSKASIPDSIAAVGLRKGESRLHFRFPDLDSNMVSIDDPRFQNKAVIIQIMGSWCPNCMDETAFLSDYYNKHKNSDVEIIALAYEYSTDFQRSQKGLRKFQKLYNVQYPMLITGVRTLDSLRTEKTLPEITPIKMFPTTIYIGKDGKVKKFGTGFTGPGTGQHYEAFRKEFYEIVDRLVNAASE